MISILRKIVILLVVVALIISPIIAIANNYNQKVAEIKTEQEKLHNIANIVRDNNLKHQETIIQVLQNAWTELENEKQNIIKQQEDNNTDNKQNLKSLGVFKIYAYCPCSYCCGWSTGITATGTKATAGRTIAVDPKIIPLGSKVMINGNFYIAEDTGGGIKGNKIDMFFNTHNEALQWGVKSIEVFIVN